MFGYVERRRYSYRAMLGYIVLRLLFFGGVAALCLYWRTSETNSSNRVALLTLTLLMATLGVVMVGQAIYGAIRGFRPDRMRGV